jgi:hypothetical protein
VEVASGKRLGENIFDGTQKALFEDVLAVKTDQSGAPLPVC